MKEVKKILTINHSDVNLNEELSAIEIERPSKTSLNDNVSSCVSIKVKNGHGSGFIISKGGYIITNYHVVSKDKIFQVILSDGKEVQGTLERYDAVNDLALIKTSEPLDNYNTILLSESQKILLGNNVFAIGTPNSLELGQTISKGIISGKRKSGVNEYIQTDVSINAGNSGGPLILDGVAIGVVSNKVIGVGVEGIGFAIPSHYIFSRLNIKYQ